MMRSTQRRAQGAGRSRTRGTSSVWCWQALSSAAHTHGGALGQQVMVARSSGGVPVAVASTRKQGGRAPTPAAGSRAVVALSAFAEAPVDEEVLRADEVRIQMAKAMNATVLRLRVPEHKAAPGNWLAAVGSLDEMGAWQPSRAARLKWLPGHEWVADVVLPEHYSGSFEFKLVLMNDKGLCVWEPGANRKMSVTDAFLDEEEKVVEASLAWGLRDPEFMMAAEQELPEELLDDMLRRAEQAVNSMPGLNAATVLLQSQQQLSDSKRRHREQVTELRGELARLQDSSRRETRRVQTRMRELEVAMEKIQARLEKERRISEAHIALLERRIADRAFTPSTAAPATAAGQAEPTAVEAVVARPQQRASGRRAGGAAEVAGKAAGPQLDIMAFEAHVMAVLPNYSGLSLERLHTMLGLSVLTPRYERSSPDELAQLLTRLVADHKITCDNGIFRYRSREGSLVGSRGGRARTPTARTPQPQPQPQFARAQPASATATNRTSSHRVTPRPSAPRSVPAPARSSGRTYAGGEQEAQAPVGSVAGGPPGMSVAGGPPKGFKAAGGSIMPRYDSTGAHPTLGAVSELEQPVMELLATAVSGMPVGRLHDALRSAYPSHAHRSQADLAAVLKNLVDQHKLVEDGERFVLAA